MACLAVPVSAGGPAGPVVEDENDGARRPGFPRLYTGGEGSPVQSLDLTGIEYSRMDGDDGGGGFDCWTTFVGLRTWF